MTIDPLAASSAAAPQTTQRGLANIKTEDYFKLLITQLQSQDPLKPTDNQAILEQMSLIRQLESSTQLGDTLSTLAQQQRVGNSAALIGTVVSGTPADGLPPVDGVVIAVTYTRSGDAILELHNGKQLPLERVDAVTLADNLPVDGPAPVDTTGETTAARLKLASRNEADSNERPLRAAAANALKSLGRRLSA